MQKSFIYNLLVFTFISVLLHFVHSNADELRQDFRDFLRLVPKRQVGYIATKHYILDGQFRASLKYLKSSYFIKNWSEIRNSQEFIDLIDYIRRHDVSLTLLQQDITAVIDKLPNQLRTFRIPNKVPVMTMTMTMTMMMMEQRNLVSFMREVMQALPRARFSSLMVRKVTEGGDFARLYKAVQQKEFKQLMVKVKASSNLQSSWSELRKHFIEVNDLIDMTFEIISWGP